MSNGSFSEGTLHQGNFVQVTLHQGKFVQVTLIQVKFYQSEVRLCKVCQNIANSSIFINICCFVTY